MSSVLPSHIVRSGVPTIQATTRTLTMLEAVVADGGSSSISALARQSGVPVATAHRQVATLVAQGYLTRAPGGGHIAGPRLLALLQHVDEMQLILAAAEPVLTDLAARLSTITQLGTLENGMVTYRLKTGPGASNLFTKVGMQLEAYCSGIGKVLLAHMDDIEREAYLAAGPFPSLTPNTITDPIALSSMLRQVKLDGCAFDCEEMMNGVHCVAVPVCDAAGKAKVAISATFTKAEDAEAALSALLDAARAIQSQVSAR